MLNTLTATKVKISINYMVVVSLSLWSCFISDLVLHTYTFAQGTCCAHNYTRHVSKRSIKERTLFFSGKKSLSKFYAITQWPIVKSFLESMWGFFYWWVMRILKISSYSILKFYSQKNQHFIHLNITFFRRIKLKFVKNCSNFFKFNLIYSNLKKCSQL